MLPKLSAVALISSFMLIGDARAEECGREAFMAVVSKANGELTQMNDANKRAFREKLQLLKKHAGWSDSDFVAKAKPFVQDAKIGEFDLQNKELLTRVSRIGETSKKAVSLAGVAPSFETSPDKRCEMVESLRALMAELVGNSRDKWAYMIGKVDAALAAPAEASRNK